jgi:hypothetical protein
LTTGWASSSPQKATISGPAPARARPPRARARPRRPARSPVGQGRHAAEARPVAARHAGLEGQAPGTPARRRAPGPPRASRAARRRRPRRGDRGPARRPGAR